MKNDETGVYCVESGQPTRAQLDEMLRSRTEIEVQYHETRFRRGTPCWGAEDSVEGTGFEVFVVDYIGPVR